MTTELSSSGVIAFGLSEVKSSLVLIHEFIELGFGVRRCRSFDEIRRVFTDPSICAVVSESELEGEDGLEFCKGLRSETRGRTLPLIILSTTQGGRCTDLINAGADSCLPFSATTDVVVASVRSMLRRIEWDRAATTLVEAGTVATPDVLDSAGVVVRLKDFAATLHGQPMDLTPSELRILIAIMTSPNATCTRGELFRSFRHTVSSVTDRSLDSHVYSLRRKLGSAGKWLKTMRGLGYRWAAPILVK